MGDVLATTSRTASDRAERERQAERRMSGATFQEIADKVGYNSKQAAHAVVQRLLRDMVNDGVRELRLLQVHRLQDLLASVWRNAVDPEADRPDRPGEIQTPSQHLAYVKQARSLIKDLRDLHGLDQELPAQELLAEGMVFINDDTMAVVKAMRATGVTGEEIETWLRSRGG